MNVSRMRRHLRSSATREPARSPVVAAPALKANALARTTVGIDPRSDRADRHRAAGHRTRFPKDASRAGQVTP